MADLGFANGNINVAADVGNFGVKLAVESLDGKGKGKIVQMFHALHETDETTYAHLAESYSDQGTHQFLKWNGRYFICGDAALSAGDVKPLQGRSKYHKHYYGVLFMSAFLNLMRRVEDVPERINVFAGYPPGDREQKENLQRALIGNWVLDNLGKKINIRVDHVAVYDEIVGGAMNVALASDGTRIVGHPLTTDGPTIAFDLGGGTTDFLRLTRNGLPDYSKIASRRIGINDAVNTFKMLFDRKHKKLLDDALNGLPLERIYDCFHDPQHRVRMPDGYVDCQDIYQQSINRVLNAIRDALSDFSQGAVNYNYVLMTGGGSGLLEKELREQIFPRFNKANAVFMAESSKADMVYANCRGARKMIRPMIERAKQRGA